MELLCCPPHVAVTQFKHEQCCSSVDVKFTAGHILQLHQRKHSRACCLGVGHHKQEGPSSFLYHKKTLLLIFLHLSNSTPKNWLIK